MCQFRSVYVLNCLSCFGFCNHQLFIFLFPHYKNFCPPPPPPVCFSFTDFSGTWSLLGLADHDNYHEYCRLLGRFRVNYQVIYCIVTFLTLIFYFYVLFSCYIFPCYWFTASFAWAYSHVCRDCHLMLYNRKFVHVHG